MWDVLRKTREELCRCVGFGGSHRFLHQCGTRPAIVTKHPTVPTLLLGGLVGGFRHRDRVAYRRIDRRDTASPTVVAECPAIPTTLLGDKCRHQLGRTGGGAGELHDCRHLK